MTITFRPAERSGVGTFIALAAGSRAGKTYTALTIARGLAGSCAKIAAIDTEGKRMSHYVDDFRDPDGSTFDAYDMLSPFNGFRFLEAARAAQDAGYSALVIDSFSLEWSGAGGVLHKHAQYLEDAENRLRGVVDQYGNPLTEDEIAAKVRRLSDQAWNKVKGPGSEHKLQMDGFLQLTIPIIFCLRANPVADHLVDKAALKRKPSGGFWKVDQDKRFLFEWTVGLTLHPETPGVPRYDMADKDGRPLWKVQDQHRELFPEGKLITVEAGRGLAAWRNTDVARKTTSVVRDAAPTAPEEIAQGLVNRFDAVTTPAELQTLKDDHDAARDFTWLFEQHPDVFKPVRKALDRAEIRVAPRSAPVPDVVTAARKIIAQFIAAADQDAYNDLIMDPAVIAERKRIEAQQPDLSPAIDKAQAAALARIAGQAAA